MICKTGMLGFHKNEGKKKLAKITTLKICKQYVIR